MSSRKRTFFVTLLGRAPHGDDDFPLHINTVEIDIRNALCIDSVAAEYDPRGIGFVAISSNDVSERPEDGPEAMAEFAEANNFIFPYLYDETQDVAKAYDAVCTPDFFLFDGKGRCAYRGQFDGSRPKNGEPVTGADLRASLDAVLEGDPIPEEAQVPSQGCSIKWKAA